MNLLGNCSGVALAPAFLQSYGFGAAVQMRRGFVQRIPALHEDTEHTEKCIVL